MQYQCPVEATLDILGGKWKPLILFYLLDETLRFGELKRKMPDEITQQMLTRQVRELEKHGIVHREVYRQVPPKVEYSLTELGLTLKPLLLHMLEWGLMYVEKTGAELTHSRPPHINVAT